MMVMTRLIRCPSLLWIQPPRHDVQCHYDELVSLLMNCATIIGSCQHSCCMLTAVLSKPVILDLVVCCHSVYIGVMILIYFMLLYVDYYQKLTCVCVASHGCAKSAVHLSIRLSVTL